MIAQRLNRRSLLLGSAATAASLAMLPRELVFGQEAEGQELRIATAVAMGSQLDPHLTYGVTSIGLMTYFMWAGLTRMDENLEIGPDIAESWEVSDDGLIYTFHIDPERKFSDGSPITANDVAWSWNRSLNPETESIVAGSYMSNIVGAPEYWRGESTELPSGITVVDDQTLEVTLSKPQNYFPKILIHPSTIVVKQSDVEAGTPESPWWRTAKAFSGPFAITSYEEGQSAELVSNTYYPRQGPITKLTYRFVDDPQTQFLLYQNDEVDLTSLGVTDAENIKNTDDTYRAEFLDPPIFAQTNLYFRNNLAPFDDEHVRRAFMMAIDKETFLASVMKGLNPSMDGFIYPGLAPHNSDLPRIPFDVEGAKAELAQSSYGSADKLPPIQFNMFGDETGSDQRTIVVLQEMWKQNLGVEVETRVVPTYDEMLTTDVHIVVAGEALHYPDPYQCLSYLRSGQSFNIARFSSAEWDAMLEQAATTLDEAESVKLYQELEQYLIDHAVVFPIYQWTAFFVVKPTVQNLKVTSMYTFPDFDQVTNGG